ncbi:hypothetical protein [Mycolicibacterium grossiae]|uniref:Uncharacterized protein n=1 Tax=Mycolicibacterium grossiae TaxID=1552759 RepID=A0A1E8QB54_9MYCO|nr:hypothetical protein [Mycolicibacterium grossiae]OFJ55189.1 hypothetical protein BEL07_03170 [Mycolicibacterium grossiae]QEM46106.1 hypothetical protein FZ046_16235 [Mycolicibacterium grossiae]
MTVEPHCAVDLDAPNVPLPPGAEASPAAWWDYDYEYRVIYTPDLETAASRVYGSAVQRPDGSIAGQEDPPRVYLSDEAPDSVGMSLEEARTFARQILTTVEMIEGWQR